MRTGNPPQYLAPTYPDTSKAACRDADAELWFPVGSAEATQAKAVCAICPIRQACLAYALPQVGLAGVWGGLTEQERGVRRYMAKRCSGCGRRGHGPCDDQAACDEARNKRMEDA